METERLNIRGWLANELRDSSFTLPALELHTILMSLAFYECWGSELRGPHGCVAFA